MQVFTKNQNAGAEARVPDEIARWFAAQQASGISPVVSHAAYLINMARRTKRCGAAQ